MKQVGVNQGQDNSLRAFSDDDFQRVIEAMVFDQRIEQTKEGFYRATNFNFPASLASMKGGMVSSSRIVFTEIPCCHCPLAEQCSATDPQAVVNPHRCLYLQQWEMRF